MNKQHLKEFIGFGIAGNFAHHLEQAGEAGDFINVKVDNEKAPKGIFPFYLPGVDTFLGKYPLSSKKIVHPQTVDGNLQMEPEVALICEIIYENGKVKDLVPNFFTAYNDCSIRKEGAKKISEKKNWGEETKGISSQIIAIDKFKDGGIMDSYYIASFLKRDGKIYPYGENSAVTTYNYFYIQLKNWIVDKLNTQKDFDPLEDLSSYIKTCNYPKSTIISIGATSYTKFGESTFLEVNDEIFIYVYDSNIYSYDDILNNASNDKAKELNDCSILSQIVI
jgi:hypothetical protein